MTLTRPGGRPLLLDASALTAFLRRETGWQAVATALGGSTCLIGSAQLVEIEGKLVSDGSVTPAEFQTQLGLLGHIIRPVPFSLDAIRTASFYYARRRPYGLSLGDALCLGTAETLGADVMTAERTWASIPDLPFQIQTIR